MTARLGGPLALAEHTLPPRAELPMRRLEAHDAAFYVLAGEVLLVGGRRVQRAATGAVVWIPRGERHGFANPSAREPARLLAIASPAAPAARPPAA
jgi:quercetin dioxygenase-like cupin family protein